jgi:Signal transduction histidine kinase regulating citrate/malate metabolism
MANFVLCFLINVFDLFIYKKYLDALAGKKRTNTLFSVIFLAFGATVLSAVNFINIPILNLISTTFVLAGYIFQYLCEWKTKIVLLSLFLGIGFIMEPVGYLLFSLIPDNPKEDAVRCYLVVIFVEVMRAVITEIFCKLKSGKILKVDRLPVEIILILIAIPALSIISCCFIIRIASKCISMELVVLCVVIALSMIISDYLMFYMVERYASLMESKHIDAMYQQEMELKEKFYIEVQESYEYVQSLKHDLKNQLISLYDTFTEDGGVAARKKIKELYCDLKEDDKKIYTANPVLNSILKNKLAKAEENEIKTSIKVQIPMKLNIDCGDMGILYGNILDNAIEACQKIERTERYIQLDSIFSEGMLILVIQNSKLSVMNEQLVTTKANARNHGIGTLSVRAVVDKYNGTVTFTDNKDYFITKAILYGIQVLE